MKIYRYHESIKQWNSKTFPEQLTSILFMTVLVSHNHPLTMVPIVPTQTYDLGCINKNICDGHL